MVLRITWGQPSTKGDGVGVSALHPACSVPTGQSWVVSTSPLEIHSRVQFSHSVVSDSLWPHGLQHARPPCPLPTSRVYSSLCPSSRWCHPTILSCRPLLLPPSKTLSQHQGLFKGVSSSHQLPKVLEFQLQHQSFQWIYRTDFFEDGLLGSPCSPRDFQK